MAKILVEKQSHTEYLKSLGYVNNKKISGIWQHPDGSVVNVYTHPSLGKVFNHTNKANGANYSTGPHPIEDIHYRVR